MLSRWIVRLRAARWWVRALDLTSKSRYTEALRYTDWIETLGLPANGAKTSPYAIYNKILRGFILVESNLLRDALKELRHASEMIGSIGFINAELTYLRCYI